MTDNNLLPTKTLNDRVGHVVEHIRPGGGPAGYLYNLNAVAMQHSERKFDVLFYTKSDERSHWQPTNRFNLLLRIMRPLTPNFKSLFLMAVQALSERKKGEYIFSPDYTKMLQQYSCLIFHDINKAKIYINKFRVDGQKVLVMPHSPSDLSLESLEDYENFLGSKMNKSMLLRRMRTREINLYERTDGIVAPSKYALEGYFSDDKLIRSRFDHFLVNRFFSVVTGVAAKEFHHRADYRKRVNPLDKKYVVGYFGRFNEQKGFDRYLRLVKALSRESDIQFICAGAGGIDPLVEESQNLKNLGWVSDDIAEYMAAVDLIIAPNKVCYFDLAILEALSLGTPVVASSSGGNKYFGESHQGVYLFESEDELVDKVLSVLSNLPNREDIQDMFDENFTVNKFYDNHQRIAIELLDRL